MRCCLFLFLCLLAATQLPAQPTSTSIQGRVVEATTQEPIPYANVALIGAMKGTITNEGGAFRLLLREAAKSDTLRISHIGFQTKFLPLTQAGSGQVISLERQEKQLSDVVITGLTANAILGKAIEKIPENHLGTPYKSGGFYRLTTRKGERYIHLSESAFDIYHPQSESGENQFKVDRMRVIKDKRVASELNWGLSPKQIMSLDFVGRVDDWELLKKQGRKRHRFTLAGTEVIGENEVHVLAFDQLDDLKYAGYKGKLYIDAENYAFYRIEIGLSPKGLPYKKFGTSVERTLLSVLGIDLQVRREDMQANYRKVGDKYLFSDALSHVWLDLKSDRSGFDFLAKSQVDYLVTDYQLEKVRPFPKEEVMGKNKFLEWQDAGFDTTFWKDHTTILPDADFDSIAAKIDSSNAANDHLRKVRSKIYRIKKNPLARLDTIFDYYQQQDLFCGNALVEHQGEVIFQRSFNNEMTSNTAATRFRIGSTGKTFTATLLMQLEGEGKLKLSDSLGHFLPGHAHDEITLAQLLSHTSGIPDYLGQAQNLEIVTTKRMPLEEIARKMCSDPLEFEPGSKFSYSNSGFLLLAFVVEQVEGKSFGKVLQERIFDPLGMQDTFYGGVEGRENVARGWMYGQPEPTYPIENVAGAAAITSTTGDLLKWSRALEEENLLSFDRRGEMWMPKAEYRDWDADYGYGWMLDRQAFEVSGKHLIVYHPGTDFGFHTMFLKVPETQTTIILLSNNGEFPRFDMTDLILEALD